MSSPARSINNPLALIAVLAATTEASALASLPLLDYRNQSVFVWFLVGFPPFLTLLFFITLNFNRKALTAEMPSPVAHSGPDAEAGPTHAPAPLLAAAGPTAPNPSAAEPISQREHPAPTAARLHILRYSTAGDWQELHPLVHAWAEAALAQPLAGDSAAVMLLLPAQT